MSRDDIFSVNSIDEDFVFNDRVAEVFDDMLDRSIPFYRQVIEMTAALLERYLGPGDTVYDLGCSTGTTLLTLARSFKKQDLTFIGMDNSEAMISKAIRKAEMYSSLGNIQFKEKDILDLDCGGAGAVILNYTLQFIRPQHRERYLKKIHDSLRPGGVVIISEKIISRDPRLNRDFIDLYHRFKRRRGYSELEIAKKREALENVLIPFSISENSDLLKKAGFAAHETFFQWFNFTSLVAVKEGEAKVS